MNWVARCLLVFGVGSLASGLGGCGPESDTPLPSDIGKSLTDSGGPSPSRSFSAARHAELVMQERGLVHLEITEHWACASNELVQRAPEWNSWPLPPNCSPDGDSQVGVKSVLGPYDAGTEMEFVFDSGLRWHMGSLCVSGSYPEWILEGEDGGGGSCDDLTVRITVEPLPDLCPGDPFFLDEEVREELSELWERTNADAPQHERVERAAWIVRDDSGFDLVPIEPVRADACSFHLPPGQPPAGTVAWVHTHAFAPGERVGAGVCKGRPTGGIARSGPSQKDQQLAAKINRAVGNEVPFFVLDPEGVIRVTVSETDEGPLGPPIESQERFSECSVVNQEGS